MSNYVLVSFSATNAIPDDLSIITLPQGQVDYLSHNWQEEDVWRSWRNMTKQKNEIANGMRLENASWRTWWKQRNNLKTVTPETLNWLKDSDVTWLYGPLHTAVESTPPPKQSPPVDTNDIPHSDRLDLNLVKKPILKHRSISELLTSDLPSPLFSPADSEDEDPSPSSPLQHHQVAPQSKPPLLHTKSDTHITRWVSNRPYRKYSPPRVTTLQGYSAPHSNSNLNAFFAPTSASSRSPSSGLDRDRDNSPPGCPSATHPKKKHISFNTFVEQCIAIEKPKKSFAFSHHPDHALGYDSGGEDHSVPVWNGHRPVTDPDSDSEAEDEDDVLEMRTSTLISQSRSKSKASSTSSSSISSTEAARYRPQLVRNNSVDRERVTIAPIAPTMLKTNGVGDDEYDPFLVENQNDLVYERERKDSGGRTPVELVYVPPFGSNYSVHLDEDDTIVPVLVASPIPITRESVVGADDNPYDYFGGPDLGKVQNFPRRRSSKDGLADDGDRPTEQYSSADVLPRAPELVVNGGTGDTDTRGRSRSRSNSRSRTPSPLEFPSSIAAPAPVLAPSPTSTSLPVPQPHGRSASYSPPTLLSPPPIRGRASLSKSSSATQLGGEPQSQSRGRSSTRTSSSVSERERSSRGSSVGDSTSPELPLGSGVGSGRMVGGSGRGERVRSGAGATAARGRDRERVGRRLSGGSWSPEDVAAAISGTRESSTVSSLDTVVLMPSESEVIGGRTLSISSAPVVPAAVPISPLPQPQPPSPSPASKPSSAPIFTPPPASPTTTRATVTAIAIPPPSPIHHDPTPTLSSSPVSVPRAHTSRAPSSSSPIRSTGMRIGGVAGPLDDAENPTLVGRAVEIVSTAGAFLGFWNNNGGVV